MIVRRFVGLVVAAVLIVGACGGDPEPPPPPPPPPVDNSAAERQALLDAEARRLADEETARLAAEREEAAALARRVAAARTSLQEMVFFDYDVSEIRDDAAALLRTKVNILRASPQVRLLIEGHCDERGSTEYNLALGNRRAVAIRQFLTGFGLSENRFEIVSFGEGQPNGSGSNEAAWARNRRGQFVITAGGDAINPAD